MGFVEWWDGLLYDRLDKRLRDRHRHLGREHGHVLTGAASALGAAFDAATVGRWYSWRWRVGSYFKRLKSAGQNVQGWEQYTGSAVAKRLVLASTACLTVGCLQREPGPAAAEGRRVRIRRSGRQMGHGVESTAAALLGGLGKRLAVLDLMAEYDLADLRRLVAHVLPNLSDSG